MRTAMKAAAAATAAALLAALGAAPAQAAPQTWDNGVPVTTTGGERMHAHGGGVVTVGDTYYMVGEQRVGDGHLFNAVSMYRSTDLVNWTHANDILTRDSHPDLDPSNLERPKVVYNAQYDHYVMWAHKENGTDYGDAEVAVAVSDSVDGDYEYRGAFRPLGHESRDQTVYVDRDGTAYLVSAASSNYDLHVYRLSDDYLEVEELVHAFVGDHREAPAVFERDGVHFLLTSGASGWNPNQQRYATTTNFPAGPWSEWHDVGDATTYGSQTTYVLEVSGTAGTSYMYMGDRWAGASGGPPNDSTYVWLPLRFPTADTMAMDWSPRISIDAAAGTVTGAAGETTTIVARHSGGCADVVSGSTADGAEVIQYGCNGGTNQRWLLQPAGEGYHQITAWGSGKCLDVSDASSANGAKVIQWTCNGGANQQWQLRESGGYTQLVARHSGKCVDVTGASAADGARLQQWDCNDGRHQQFTL